MQAFGPATDYQLCGPLVLNQDRVDRKEYADFFRAICSQGAAEVRQQAISLALDRARRDTRLSNRGYRVFSQIASVSRWAYRYHCETLGLLAHSSAGDRSNLHRDVDHLVDLKYCAEVHVPRRGGGKPTRFLTIICTEQDRSGETRTLLDRAARSATGEQPNRQDDGSPAVLVTDSGISNPSPGRTAERRSDEHIVDSDCEREEIDGAQSLIDQFEKFWEVYPRKISKGDAWNAWHLIVTGKRQPNDKSKSGGVVVRAEPAELLEGARRFAAAERKRGTDEDFIPHPRTWLSGQRWLDGQSAKSMAEGRPVDSKVVVCRDEDPEAFAAWVEFYQRTGNTALGFINRMGRVVADQRLPPLSVTPITSTADSSSTGAPCHQQQALH